MIEMEKVKIEAEQRIYPISWARRHLLYNFLFFSDGTTHMGQE